MALLGDTKMVLAYTLGGNPSKKEKKLLWEQFVRAFYCSIWLERYRRTVREKELAYHHNFVGEGLSVEFFSILDSFYGSNVTGLCSRILEELCMGAVKSFLNQFYC